ncbi:FG-GAP-like repeat-containing protein [Flavobacterium cerinum]|uniref:FG-GAP-like repeat-containing protein n=1 Tax=Flavobacterium cerinum TaxID=2502784 RepID=A0ABY5IS93_9FLAO|nr:FG-GAP-like repeat-containing protein [Flavobacterium cerinum]UUC45161.1 FG-GAP-like repeat-containing protein [Flavobacterium cerinum]
MKTALRFMAVVVIPSFSLQAQSFERMHFPDITTTLSSSRSANFIDVNNDGWDDIFFTNGLSSGEQNMLYINNTDGTFTTVTDDDIVEHSIRAVGASFADTDNDGDLDGYVVTWGVGGIAKRNYFYRNNGNGTFTFDPGVAPNPTYSETANWIDINNDQLLDLYITNSAQSLRNLYFENQGDGTFLQRTDLTITNEVKPSRSVDWVDYDNDGDNDLFVTNEMNNTNTLYRNDGPNNFTQITNLNIVQDIKDSLGSSWADVDNDGDFDLLVANWEQGNQLFINNNGVFTEMTGSAIALETVISFGSTFGDIDNDGDLDLFIGNSYSDTHFKNSVFINDGHGNFTQDHTSALALQEGWTYGAAFGDYNNDGWLDIILANNQNESQVNSVYKNTGTGNNWVKIKCVGTVSNKSAIGAVVKVTSVINGNVVTQTRKVEAASGYASQNSLTTHFGLGDAGTIQTIQIKWPSGLIENFTGGINTAHNFIEGTGVLSVGEQNKIKVNIYPNPVKDQFYIEIPEKGAYHLAIINTQGQTVKEIKIDGSDVHHEVNIADLPAGTYFYNVSENKAVKNSGKIIKQ